MKNHSKNYSIKAFVCLLLGLLLVSTVTSNLLVRQPYELTVETNKAQYSPGEEVVITGQLTDDGQGMQWGVCVNITDPNSDIIQGVCMETNETGYYVMSFELAQDALIGTYLVTASAHIEEEEIIAQATFEVIIPTGLQIGEISGGIGKVCVVIKNVGDDDATGVISTISVRGGFLNLINVTTTCSGCGQCNATIEAHSEKTECTDSFIFGLGPIDISVSAEADNADLVTAEASGFVLGFLVLIS